MFAEFLSYLRLLAMLLVLICSFNAAHGQFSKAIGNTSDNVFTRVKPDLKNTLACGFMISPNNGLPYATLSNLDANGSVIWHVVLDIPSTATDFEIMTDEVGAPAAGFLLIGRTEPSTNTNNQSFVARFNTNGALNWLKVFDQTGREGFQRIVRRHNPRPQLPYYFISGTLNDAQNVPSTFDEGTIWVIDADGNVVRRWRYEDQTAYDSELGLSIINWDVDEMLIVGNRLDNAGGRYGLLYRINESTGAVTMARRLEDQQIIRDVYRYTANGQTDVLIAGYTHGTSLGFVAKLNGNDLSVKWWHEIKGQKNLYDLGTDVNNRIYVTGLTDKDEYSVLCLQETGPGASLVYAYQVSELGNANFQEGHLWVRPTASELLYADARNRGTNSFGGLDVVINKQDLNWSGFGCLQKLERFSQNLNRTSKEWKLLQFQDPNLEGKPAKAKYAEYQVKDFCCNCANLPAKPIINGAACFCKDKLCNDVLSYTTQLPAGLQNCTTLQWAIAPAVAFTGQGTTQIGVNCQNLNPGQTYTITLTLKCGTKVSTNTLQLTVCQKTDPGFSVSSTAGSLTAQATTLNPGQHFWFLVQDNDGNCGHNGTETYVQGNGPSFQFNGLQTNQQYVLYHIVFNNCNPACYCITSKQLCFKWSPNQLKPSDPGTAPVLKIQESLLEEAKIPGELLNKVKQLATRMDRD